MGRNHAIVVLAVGGWEQGTWQEVEPRLFESYKQVPIFWSVHDEFRPPSKAQYLSVHKYGVATTLLPSRSLDPWVQADSLPLLGS
jgi:hypothetical protein